MSREEEKYGSYGDEKVPPWASMTLAEKALWRIEERLRQQHLHLQDLGQQPQQMVDQERPRKEQLQRLKDQERFQEKQDQQTVEKTMPEQEEDEHRLQYEEEQQKKKEQQLLGKKHRQQAPVRHISKLQMDPGPLQRPEHPMSRPSLQRMEELRLQEEEEQRRLQKKQIQQRPQHEREQRQQVVQKKHAKRMTAAERKFEELQRAMEISSPEPLVPLTEPLTAPSLYWAYYTTLVLLVLLMVAAMVYRQRETMQLPVARWEED